MGKFILVHTLDELKEGDRKITSTPIRINIAYVAVIQPHILQEGKQKELLDKTRIKYIQIINEAERESESRLAEVRSINNMRTSEEVRQYMGEIRTRLENLNRDLDTISSDLYQVMLITGDTYTVFGDIEKINNKPKVK